MKKIIKTTSPQFFEEWKDNFIQLHGTKPTYKEDLVGEIKQRLKYELLKEQGYICCYCMAKVEINSHIEHFLPQSKSDSDLNYFNMFISCNGYKDKHENCGHKKANECENLLSPLDIDIENQFKYLPDGRIVSLNNSSNATVTIEKLGLDSFALTRARKTAIYISGLFDDDISKEQIDNLVHDYSCRDSGGAFTPFCQAIIFCLLNN